MAKIKQKACRLCLKDIKQGSFKTIDNIKIEMLEVLLIGMDFNICEETMICDQCAAKLQECFDFKSNCFFVEDCIVPFMVDNERLDLKMVIEKKMKIGKQVQLDNYKICRLCMQVVQDNDFIYFDNLNESASIRDMLQTCLSELDVNSTIDALICKICVESLKNYHDFKESCLDVEKKIKEYQSEELENNSIEKVELCDLLKKKNAKKNVKRNVKSERGESDSRNQRCAKVLYTSEHKTNLNMDAHMDGHMDTRQEPGQRKLKKCKFCNFEENTYTTISFHMKTHKNDWEIKWFECDFCNFETKTKYLLARHKKRCHSKMDELILFKCLHCVFQTHKKDSLRNHLLTHKNADEVEMFSCKQCCFKSKYRTSILRHTKKMHEKDVKKYKCSLCSYQTIEKCNLRKHQVVHLNPGETQWKDLNKYKCSLCSYQTIKKYNLRKHQVVHLNPGETQWKDLNKYKCSLCSYRTIEKTTLKMHQVVHLNPGETQWKDLKKYKCSLCSYRTIAKDNLRRHQVVHLNPGETQWKDLNKYKCSLCSYQTIQKSKLKRHQAVHLNPGETQWKDLNKYKCSLCSYRTIEKTTLKMHQVVHLNPGETQWKDLKKYKCSLCSYRTIAKDKLKMHQVVHLNPGETPMYQCATCNFETKYKYNLIYHFKVCKKKNNNEKRKQS